ncbi:isopenicillin N synthase family dioxygenase [Tropicibacter naphthalenivorans]|uniref:2-oxoglutarate-dependent ethylene/succinate-forming enzyme n=1 Tax=Tropicibacter naphthalenivorans TaxID=441103 RepID=A0A0N7M0G7_9RHOB|nr:2OG-Fe(II) oxygenase family protein [Tropicibacter naphthalenivorans]CUH80417.1 2-oxoglutarate-dependent ethylene/succinate-forming enzyme [Tropicibacter naphthalenivorans]SMC86234.1 Isopenicillin N synthase [Tropicibacter naphthalenivorans]
MIPRLDVQKIAARDPQTLAELRQGAEQSGFLTVYNTAITPARMRFVIAAYRAFFDLPEAQKAKVDMARTGSNRGWGAPQSEQVDPDANPDYKQVFDCGFQVPGSDLAVYAPNLWPEKPEGFQQVVAAYYRDALEVAMTILRGIAEAIGQDAGYFDDKFDQPMALLRSNYYPPRPDWAGDKDFGIAAHTDYGCLTLLGTDGVPGLEVLTTDGDWLPVEARPGEFIINFGEMLEMWTNGQVKATLHRVKGSSDERISVPLFFNPNHDTNVAPMGSGEVIHAGDHLTKRFNETYLHLQDKA